MFWGYTIEVEVVREHLHRLACVIEFILERIRITCDRSFVQTCI